MSIKVENISRFFGEQKALDRVSFEIQTGQIAGFLGPNGAGKSTMMKIITGFLPPTEGKSYVNHLEIGEDPIGVKKLIGYLPENNPLYLDMYVKEYLDFVSGIYGIKSGRVKQIKQIIERVGLTIEQHKKIGALSKGYRQRVGLAQALVHEPPVLILDEPTSGLDPNQIIEIRNLIAELGREKTVLLSTHIMQEVEALCERVIIINKGCLVADDDAGKVGMVTNTFRQCILVEFSGEIESNRLKAIAEIAEVHTDDKKSWSVYSNSEKDLRPILFDFAVNNKLQVLSLQKQEKSLEQVFQELTRK